MTDTVELVGKLGAQIGPVGVFLLLALAIYLQSNRTKRYHGENVDRLSGIAKSAADADKASVETLRIVREMNGRLIALEVWKQQHDLHDSERFQALERTLERVGVRHRREP